ncbi:MAG: hypothetical protein ACE5SW_11650 [Nitrososphaeraceae archaeon]
MISSMITAPIVSKIYAEPDSKYLKKENVKIQYDKKQSKYKHDKDKHHKHKEKHYKYKCYDKHCYKHHKYHKQYEEDK